MRIRVIIAVIFALYVSSCSAVEESVTKRFRVDASIEMAGRTFSASQIWEVEVHWKPTGLPDVPWADQEVRGEALAFPISDEETLFLLRRGPKIPTSPGAGAWILECVEVGSIEEFMPALAGFSGGCEVEIVPMFARAIGSSQATPDLSLIDETAVKLLGVSVQVTEQPITTGLSATYPWIAGLPKLGQLASSRRIYQEDFSTEVR